MPNLERLNELRFETKERRKINLAFTILYAGDKQAEKVEEARMDIWRTGVIFVAIAVISFAVMMMVSSDYVQKVALVSIITASVIAVADFLRYKFKKPSSEYDVIVERRNFGRWKDVKADTRYQFFRDLFEDTRQWNLDAEMVRTSFKLIDSGLVSYDEALRDYSSISERKAYLEERLEIANWLLSLYGDLGTCNRQIDFNHEKIMADYLAVQSNDEIGAPIYSNDPLIEADGQKDGQCDDN